MAPPTKSQFSDQKRGRQMTILQELRTLQADNVQPEDIVATLAIAKAIRKEFEESGALVEAPAWLDDKIRSLQRELKLRTADVLEKRLADVRAKRDSLKTAEERRRDLDAEAERIQKAREAIGV
jgi:vacuolar-type H+-ATPase subunit I/STV1